MWIDDQIIAACENDFVLKSWVPDQTMVVLGRSNRAATECHVQRAQADGVQILKRYGGGGAVVLYPGCLIVSLGFWAKDRFKNDVYFKLLNKGLMTVLSRCCPALEGRLTQRGISDLAVTGDGDDRKFAGTSLFRSRNYLLFQASIIVDMNLDLVNSYLKHPSREPDYRKSRDHGSFLTSLQAHAKDLSVEGLSQSFQDIAEDVFRSELTDEMLSAKESQVVVQIPHLKAKRLQPDPEL